MGKAKEQLNVRLDEDLAVRIRRCAVVSGISINAWATAVLREKADQEYKERGLDKLEEKFAEVSQEYRPGRVASLDEMLEMAKVFASAETRDGLNTKHVLKARRAREKTGSRKA
jgi:predicted house-cleaning noncanonical NTP pyrophosphatase (MazG superfamily)